MALLSLRSNKVLSVFSLVMINVIAVANLRTLAHSAIFGSSLIFYYVLIAILIFFPIAMITAELATTWPKGGGIYLWVREAFGPKWGFLVIWLQWVYNLAWYPTILATIASVLAYLIDPQATTNPWFVVLVSLIVFWIATIGNFFGMQVSGWISSICSMVGTIIPMVAIISLGAWWLLFDNHNSQISLSWNSIIPQIDSLADLAWVPTIIFGLMGLEMSAVHVQEVKNPQHDYPASLRYSTVIILSTLLISSLIVAMVVPGKELNIVTGVVQAFKYFCDELHMPWMLPAIAIAILIGAIGAIAAWIIGPTKGLLVAAQEDNLPEIFAKTNKKNVPVSILCMQGLIVSLLTSLYVFLPSVVSAYVILSQLTGILALLMYVLIFAAAITLRYKNPHIARPYKIPGGMLGMWIVGLVGGISSLFAMLLGFVPPSQINTGDPVTYQLLLVIGVVLFCSPAIFIHRRKRYSFHRLLLVTTFIRGIFKIR